MAENVPHYMGPYNSGTLPLHSLHQLPSPVYIHSPLYTEPTLKLNWWALKNSFLLSIFHVTTPSPENYASFLDQRPDKTHIHLLLIFSTACYSLSIYCPNSFTPFLPFATCPIHVSQLPYWLPIMRTQSQMNLRKFPQRSYSDIAPFSHKHPPHYTSKAPFQLTTKSGSVSQSSPWVSTVTDTSCPTTDFHIWGWQKMGIIEDKKKYQQEGKLECLKSMIEQLQCFLPFFLSYENECELKPIHVLGSISQPQEEGKDKMWPGPSWVWKEPP